MRNVIVSFLSFALGATCMSLLGNHTSTFAQESTNRSSTTFAVCDDCVPPVPQFRNIVFSNPHLEGLKYDVDGFLCTGCERVRAGVRNARAKGKRLGRPRSEVDADQVAQLRASGASWREVERQLAVSVRSARRAISERGKIHPASTTATD